MRRFMMATFAASTFGPLCPLPAAFAQPQQPGMMSSQSAAEITVSVEFAGGTVLQYVEALKKSGKPINIVASERTGRQPLSAISLSQVPVGVAVYAISAAAISPSGSWRIEPIYPPGMRMPGTSDAYTVDYSPQGRGGEDMMVESFSLQKIIRPESKGGGLDATVVLTAIETGLKLQNEGSGQAPDLQFHPDSGLLFVRGTAAEVRLVGAVVGRMSEDAGRRSTAAERKAREEAMRALAVKEANLQVQLREMELNAATRSLEEAKALLDKGMIGQGDIARQEIEAARARYNLEKSKLGLERAQLTTLEPETPTVPDGISPTDQSSQNEISPRNMPRMPNRPAPR